VKYRYTVVHDGTVEADTAAEAEAAALAEVEDGLCITYGVQVEPLDRERDE
jgi:hypothetical protein